MNNFTISSGRAPHIKMRLSVNETMLAVIIALFPALVWSSVRLGLRSLIVCFVCVFMSVLFEFSYQMLVKRQTTIHDLSAVVTGMLIAFNMPVAVPLYIPIIACFIAIIVVKQAFGGIGKNYVNPAAAAVVLVSLIWQKQMQPTFVGSKLLVNIDNIESAPPLSRLLQGEIPSESFFDLFFGNINGTIGAISAAMLILGALYLLWKRVISWHIPVSYLGTSALLFYMMSEQGLEIEFTVSSLCAGALMLSAFYMATDYTTTPMTKNAKIAFGVGCAIITVFLRRYVGFSQDALTAILIMNVCSPVLDVLLRPKLFGCQRKKS